jgi:hypothetical protein
LSWGYAWEEIRWEEAPKPRLGDLRPDIYALGKGKLPSFWFECRGTSDTKLRRIVQAAPAFRTVHIFEYHGFLRWWNAENVVPSKVTDRKQRKEIILNHRREVSVPGAEYWAVLEESTTARILFAVRRERSGEFTYLDSGEGWSLSSVRYVSKRADRFAPIIPGVVGSEHWRGENPSLMSK